LTGRELTITASSASVKAGRVFTPNASVSGLAAGDKGSATSVTYSYAGKGSTNYGPSRTQPNTRGTYSVTPSGGSVAIMPSANQGKYTTNYAYVAGTLVVTDPPKVIVTKVKNITPFAEGSYSLTPKLLKQIEDMAVIVKNGGYKVIRLAGYTDNVFTPSFNATLTQNRAQAVATQLTADLNALGVNVSGVTILVVTGTTIELVDSNTTAKGRSLNRRVVATLSAE
jgi:outer membrane protein OmpA-like peptidoglycan-associated protein